MMLLSGAIGGLAGGVHALGTVFRYVSGFSPGYGFVGIAVALLGRGNAWGMLLAAILFGALATSGATIQLFSNVPIEIVNILQGMVMIFAVARLGRIWKGRAP
jgi:simple sugar transport system permease protein